MAACVVAGQGIAVATWADFHRDLQAAAWLPDAAVGQGNQDQLDGRTPSDLSCGEMGFGRNCLRDWMGVATVQAPRRRRWPVARDGQVSRGGVALDKVRKR